MNTLLIARVPAAVGAVTVTSLAIAALGLVSPASAQPATDVTPPPGYVHVDHGSTHAQEDATAACMAAAGFQYVPFGFTFDTYAPMGPDGRPAESAGSPEHPFVETIDGPAPDENPNAGIVDALTVPQRVAYHHALYGDRVTLDDQGNRTGLSLDVTDGACAS